MSAPDRRQLICAAHPPGAPDSPERIATGLNFVRVVDRTRQDLLAVFFINDPRITRDPGTASGFMADPASPAGPFDATAVRIVPVEPDGQDPSVEVDSAAWALDPGADRVYLAVRVVAPGGFGAYRLTLRHPAVDRFANSLIFSFKQACPSEFDCGQPLDCPEAEEPAVAVDYLARDFDSFRRALLDFAALRYPQWSERIEADLGVMLAEVLCAQADEFSYIQDRMARESQFATATQRRSLVHMARLVDYDVDAGATAEALLSFTVAPDTSGGGAAPRGLSLAPGPDGGLTVWAPGPGERAVPFQLRDDLSSPPTGDDFYWVHSNWNAMPAFTPDTAEPCLPPGATELFLAPGRDNASPLFGSQPAGSPRPESEAWIGRTLILRMAPAEAERPHRTHAVTVTEVEILSDPVATPPGEPTWQITRIAWDPADALPAEFALPDTVVLGNVVPARAGRLVTEYLRFGPVPAGDPRAAAALPVTRASALYDTGLDDQPPGRRTNTRFALGETVAGGLAFVPDPDRGGRPSAEVTVDEVAGVSEPQPSLGRWDYTESLIEAGAGARVFTLEPGQWREIRRFQRRGETFAFADYASGAGYTLVFGDGMFGRPPGKSDLLRVRYRLNPGAAGNLPRGAVNALRDPADPDAPPPFAGALAAVENPLPTTGGRDPESDERIRRFAPVLFRENVLRAVVEADFREILKRLSTVQDAGAPQRWTGSWLTRQVTADIRGEQGLPAEQRALVAAVADTVRQAGREVVVVDPIYRPLDLVVTICVGDGARFAQVREAVLERLTGTDRRPGLFHSDRFTFGTPLVRSVLEAEVHKVPGVAGIERILVRPHSRGLLRPFTEPELRVGGAEILRLRNDPRYPDQGSIRVEDHAAAQSEAEAET